MRLFHRPSRALIALAVTIAGSLAWASVPAQAAGTTISVTRTVGVSLVVTDCPSNGTNKIGQQCRVWTLSGTYNKVPNGTVTMSIDVVGYLALVTSADGTVSSAGAIAGATATSGIVTINAKTGKIDFTVNMACTVPGCVLGGATRFNLSSALGPGSFFTSNTNSNSTETPECAITQTTFTSSLERPKITGTVKVGTKSASVRRYVKDSSSVINAVVITNKQVQKPVCL